MYADDLDRPRSAVRLELGVCLDGEREAIQHAVRVEVGEDTPVSDDASAVQVGVDCAADGLDAGVILDVRQPGSPRRYRYALEWRGQPLDARSRLIGLAVAEAIAASRIELTAVPEPVLATSARASIAAPVTSRVAPAWTVVLVGDRRAFSARGGVALLGVGVMPARRLSPHLHLATDVVVEGATVLTDSGAVAVFSVSSAPRIVYRAGDRLHAEIGVGARVGVVRMHGEAPPRSPLLGKSLLRTWLGPAATVAVGTDLTPGVVVSACLELGLSVADATARDLGTPVAVLGGAWTSLGLAATIAL